MAAVSENGSTPIKFDYDLVIIGAGVGGHGAALHAVEKMMEYALKTGGLVRDDDYPYIGIDGTCKLDRSKIVASVSNFSVIALDEDEIAANLVKNGPLAIAINAMYMQTYIGGVSCHYICSKRQDHGVSCNSHFGCAIKGSDEAHEIKYARIRRHVAAHTTSSEAVNPKTNCDCNTYVSYLS